MTRSSAWRNDRAMSNAVARTELVPLRAKVPLQLVVQVNTGIRTVIAISRRVNLVAVNAMLAAKQSGAQARGFGVVSAELRNFSSRLDQQMQDLDVFIYSLVHGVAESARVHRRQMHFQAACRCVAARPSLAAGAGRIDSRLADIDGHSAERWDGLRSRLDHALRLCGTGVALSRAAKIEAVYGSAQAGGLRQVAEEIEKAIADILGTLKQLRADVSE